VQPLTAAPRAFHDADQIVQTRGLTAMLYLIQNQSGIKPGGVFAVLAFEVPPQACSYEIG
jgi:hypothetical protein